MNLHLAFASPIWRDHLSDVTDEDLAHLKNFILEEESRSDGQIRSNRGGWQSNDHISDEVTDKILNQLFSYFEAKANHCLISMGSRSAAKVDNVWFNVSRKGNYNDSHCHLNTPMSGVFYVNVPDHNARIRFYNPNPMVTYCNSFMDVDYSSDLTFHEVWFEPVEKHLIMFPGWMFHSVDKNESDEPRISIAFNIKLVPKTVISSTTNAEIINLFKAKAEEVV